MSVVAIGVSTGGPNALVSLLLALPRDFPVPIVIVQHMPPVFTRLLAQRLTALGGIPVEEAVNAGTVVPGRAYLAPGDFHLEVERQNGTVVARLHQGMPEHSCRPAVDVLFRSIAQTYGAGTLAVVLTGMGKDGLAGCERIKAAGGQVIVQDQGTSVVWGMPGFVANAGMADAVLPLSEIGREIVRRTSALSPNSCANPASAGRAAPAA